MELVILAIARFRSDQKEAMSKNFVNLAQCLTENGHQIIAISPTGFHSCVEVEQHTFRDESRYESLFEGAMNLVHLCKTLNRMIKIRPSAQINLHIATPIELLLIFFFLSSQFRKQTTISIWQSYLTFEEVRTNKRYFLRNWFRYLHILLFNSFVSAPLYKGLLGYFHQAIVHSNYQKQQLSQSKAPVYFIQNGVFPEHFSPPVITKNKLKKKILYIGHAKPSKGVDAMIELAATLKQRGNLKFDVTLCLSGFGDQKSIEKLVYKHDLYSQTEFKENIDITVEMASADLLILPLRTCVGTSLTPNLIVEALSCGLPIAVPEFEQLSGVIQFGSNAIKIDLENLEESAKAIEVCFELDQVERLSENQFKQFKAHYTLEKFTSGYSQILGLI
ncbi:glycosyltransferase [Vibrio fluvialis]|uniref:glycosyltransferase family 4 protein n=1 Tax=Vibrio fluvialis TaxID=676 RepID=UPI001C9BD356|nr:glycosyltransferase [Vibrio fluvialis]MBY7817293.1 glycosyltransferase [Vibrio fluvialis]MBY8080184.1 glycosyltransferase [Vibrio fluvialis]